MVLEGFSEGMLVRPKEGFKYSNDFSIQRLTKGEVIGFPHRGMITIKITVGLVFHGGTKITDPINVYMDHFKQFKDIGLWKLTF